MPRLRQVSRSETNDEFVLQMYTQLFDDRILAVVELQTQGARHRCGSARPLAA